MRVAAATLYTIHFENVIGNNCDDKLRSTFVMIEQADILQDYMLFDWVYGQYRKYQLEKRAAFSSNQSRLVL